jgi:type II secretory pathway component PulJ
VGGGFTLLEVMLALSILMMVLAVIYSTWNAILRAKQAADKAALQAQRSRIAVRALEDALEGVQVFQQNQPYYAFLADTSGQYAFLSVASRLPASFPGSGLFGDQTLRRVTFQVENGTNGQPQLVLRQYPLLLSTNAIEEAYPIVLATEVTDFLLEFWDARRGEWQAEWLYTNQLPPVVRFLVGVGQRRNDPSMPQAVQVQTVALSANMVPFDLQGRPGGGRPPPPLGTNQPPPGPINPPPSSGPISRRR